MVVSVWLLLATVMGLSIYASYHVLSSARDENSRLRVELATQQQRLAELQQQAKAHQADPKLQQQLAEQELRIKNERDVLRVLNSKTPNNGAGYAQLMRDLASYHNQSIWLSEVVYTAKTVTLQGTATRPDAITQWLANLNQSAYFSGMEFKNLNISSGPNERTSNFSVSSVAAVQDTEITTDEEE